MPTVISDTAPVDVTDVQRTFDTWPDLRSRIRALIDPDSDWERQVPAHRLQRDVIGTVIGLILSVIPVELSRSVGLMKDVPLSVWQQYALIALAVVPLAVRRRYPVTVMLIVAGLLSLLSPLAPAIAAQWPVQVAFMVAIYTALAWSKNRRMALFGLAGVAVMIGASLAYNFAFSSSFEDYLRSSGALEHTGLLTPLTANVLYGFLINANYILAAAAAGQIAWRGAWQRERLAEQNIQLLNQAATLKEQAQVEERLRIARELHDVVAHHVSVIGVQAAAARKVMGRNPDQAAEALTVVESSSRNAVTEMRSLLGTLRGTGQAAQTREPDPTAADIPALVRQDLGITVDFTLVEDTPGALTLVPPAVGLSLYRVVQESLANVRRHSTATSATVAVRIGRDRDGRRFAEAEILDAGRPRGGTSGSGLGLLGVRERLSSLGGVSEIGPRPTGGYRVRIRFPINN